ncbi:hypothetical protein DPMN_029248 [Dreissena polymorpha]|uniref:Uncharacterized protein n=1 Tax=Dreissena polymorpha TaxID=45954 RepID=A0A9D4RF34_DREPO|nr:hypothetical protein DPMN_029248 [Dreissena polymorpha]
MTSLCCIARSSAGDRLRVIVCIDICIDYTSTIGCQRRYFKIAETKNPWTDLGNVDSVNGAIDMKIPPVQYIIQRELPKKIAVVPGSSLHYDSACECQSELELVLACCKPVQ